MKSEIAMADSGMELPEVEPVVNNRNDIPVLEGHLIIPKDELLYFSTICALMISGTVRRDMIFKAAESMIGPWKMETFKEVFLKYCGYSVALWSRDLEGNYRLNIDQFLIV